MWSIGEYGVEYCGVLVSIGEYGVEYGVEYCGVWGGVWGGVFTYTGDVH